MHYYVLKKALLDFHYFFYYRLKKFLIFILKQTLKILIFGNLINIYLLHKYSNINEKSIIIKIIGLGKWK